MCHRTLKRKYEKLDSVIENNINKEDYKDIFLKAEEIFGYISESLSEYLRDKLNLSDAKIRGIIKYNSIREEPKGKYDIKVCMGSTCKNRGGAEIIKEVEEQFSVKLGEITDDGKVSLNDTHCTGACVDAPVLSINGRMYKEVSQDEVKEVLKGHIK